MKNIVLVGFMGSGKSTVAKLLAKTLDIDYVNTDSIIEAQEGISVNEIFNRHGEAYFRKRERAVIIDVSERNSSVIDTGGGVVINSENVEDLKRTGLVFCLNASPEEIYRRTKAHAHRPLLNVDDPIAEIDRLLKERRVFYDKAEYQIDTDGKSAEEIVRKIADLYKLNGK